MSYQADVSDAYKYWDNPESGTLRAKRAGQQTTYEIPLSTICQGKPRHKETHIAGVELQSDDVIYMLPAAFLVVFSEPFVPAIGDTLEVGAKNFALAAVDTENAGPSLSHYRCVCRGVRANAI